MVPTENFQRLALEGMARSDDGHSLRVAIEVVVGSLS